MKQPIQMFGDLTTFGASDAIFSPDEQFIVTGTSLQKESSTARLMIFDKRTLQKVKQIGITAWKTDLTAWIVYAHSSNTICK